MTLLKRTRYNLRHFTYGHKVSRRFTRQYLRRFDIDAREWAKHPKPETLDPRIYRYVCNFCGARIRNKELINQPGMIVRCPHCYEEHMDRIFMMVVKSR
jgi:DNA-directed RNA polymerase subunit RPC12/RpoP